MREEVGYLVKGVSDKAHKELTPEWIYQIFTDNYVNAKQYFLLMNVISTRQTVLSLTPPSIMERMKEW